jgi:hypothetical protein
VWVVGSPSPMTGHLSLMSPPRGNRERNPNPPLPAPSPSPPHPPSTSPPPHGLARQSLVYTGSDVVFSVLFLLGWRGPTPDVYARICSCRHCWASKCRGL